MTLSKPLLSRALIAKYLLLRARDTLAVGSPFAPGIAILQLQDSVEMLLRTVAEHLNAPLKETTAFAQLVDAVASAAKRPLLHRSALNQLNKARTNFKHFGLEPQKEDARKLLADMEEFTPWVVTALLATNYEDLSLRSLVGHRRTENWLRNAEEAFAVKEYGKAIAAAAGALRIFQGHLGQSNGSAPVRALGKMDFRSSRLVEDIQDRFDALQSQMDLLMDGIHLPDYRRFRRLAPAVQVYYSGKVVTLPRVTAPDAQDDAAFCIRFATDAILTIKTNHLPPTWPAKRSHSRRLRVISECDVLVYPEKEPEVLRRAISGELLVRHPQRTAPKSFVPILEDGDCAYVPAAAVQLDGMSEGGDGGSAGGDQT